MVLGVWARPLGRRHGGSADLEGGLEEGVQFPGGHSTPASGPGLQAVVLCSSYARCQHWRKLGEGDVGFFCIFAFYLHANLQVSKNKKLKTQISGVSPSPDSWPLSHVAIVWEAPWVVLGAAGLTHWICGIGNVPLDLTTVSVRVAGSSGLPHFPLPTLVCFSFFSISSYARV